MRRETKERKSGVAYTNPALDVNALNARARKVGYEVIPDDDPPALPISATGGVFPFNMGSGPYVRVLRGGRPCFKFSWRATEVDGWLWFREREAA